MTKGVVYYTDFHVDSKIQDICLKQLKSSFRGNAVSVSLNKPVDLGHNIVIEGERSNTMYVRQILTALEASTTDIVFFCEHDVLYNPTHFEYTPEKKDIFYYNINAYRWDYPNDRAITYKELNSLSSLCVYRDWALDHYRKRMDKIIETGWYKEDGIGKMQPRWARALGYEPGTKRRKIGGFSDDVAVRWKSKEPLVDIRHEGTLSNPKTTLNAFKHPPTDFREVKLDEIQGWNLKELFDL